MTDLSGTTIKGYAVQRKVVEGGFGAVYYALQPLVTSAGREVAIKVIRPQYANIPSFIRRFEAEAQIIAHLEHPHIVPLYDYWRDPTGAYLVMRWMSGGSLTTVLRQSHLALDAVVRVVNQLAAALTFAHRQGVVHRDIKPANILFDADGNAYLADFGIATSQDLIGATPLSESHAFTPGYASPEQIQFAPATSASDIYSLGVVLYELLTGVPAFHAATPAEMVQQQLAGRIPPVHDRRPDMPSSLDKIIQRATARDRQIRYADARQLAAEVQQLLGSMGTGHVPDRRTIVLDLADRRNPYKGLRAFQEADAADFFGREALIQRLLNRLGEPNAVARFLAVIGPSGSGKSSVVRAGVVPALRRDALPGANRWFIVDCIPGVHPWEEIEAALLRIAINPPASLLAQLQEDERGLLRAVKRVLPADEAVELVLVIDQFEELWTMVADEPARAEILTGLLMATCDPGSRLRIVVTLRADFYDRPLQYPALGELLRQRTEVVLPLTPEELEQAIVAPAQRVGVSVAPELVQAILSDVGTQPGALPLVQYVLTELFEHRTEPVLTLAAYRASGGVLGVLAHRADAVYEGLDAAEQETVRQVLVRMVALGEEVAATRRRVLRAELTEIVPDAVRLDAVLDTLGRARLLTFDHDPITRRPTIEIAHEALLRAWPRLDHWLSDDRASLRLREDLRRAAQEWASVTAPDDSLLVHSRGARLAEAMRLVERPGFLSAQEQAYVRACIALHDREVREKEEQYQRELVALEARRKAEEEARHEAEQRVAEGNRSRRSLRRRLWATILLAVAALVTGSVAAYRSMQERSIRLALLSQAELADERRDLAIALAMEANRIPLPLITAPDQARQALANVAYYTPGTRRRLVGHDGPVTSVTFSPDGHFAVSGSKDKKVIVWDPDQKPGEELSRTLNLSGTVTSTAFSPDGHTVLAGVDNDVILWNWETGKYSGPRNLYSQTVRLL